MRDCDDSAISSIRVASPMVLFRSPRSDQYIAAPFIADVSSSKFPTRSASAIASSQTGMTSPLPGPPVPMNALANRISNDSRSSSRSGPDSSERKSSIPVS